MVSNRAFICIAFDKTFSLVPRSRSFFKVKYQRHNFQKTVAVRGIHVSQTPIDSLNSLPNVKFLDLSKSKAFADNKINVTT